VSPHSEKVPHYATGVRAVYGESYAALYPSLYIEPWRRKHELNARNLKRILDALPMARPAWLDLACGQAWHFSLLPSRARMHGLDLSPHQIQRARSRAPEASFICADMLRAPLRPDSFDLVTNFWAGYCYLGSPARIERLLRNVTSWIRPGGTFYMEVLLARDLESFNHSRFSGATGFAVVPRSRDYTEWGYDDLGGRHVMASPPLAFFLDVLTPAFDEIEARHDGSFMVHLIATRRRA
jgi:SAM-dependent methyltransferase